MHICPVFLLCVCVCVGGGADLMGKYRQNECTLPCIPFVCVCGGGGGGGGGGRGGRSDGT